MKNLNAIQFVANAAEEIAGYKKAIEGADSFESAKRIGNMAIGYIDCMITFMNTMICFENNDFTGALDDVIDGWKRAVYQTVIDYAVQTEQDSDTLWELMKKRDEA